MAMLDRSAVQAELSVAPVLPCVTAERLVLCRTPEPSLPGLF